MRRRELLTSIATLPLGGLAGCAGPSVTPPRERLETFGLQLSTLTPLMFVDFDGTLARVAEIGYRQVEFSALGFLGRPVERIQQLLAENGLSAPVGRISPVLPADFASLSRAAQRAEFRRRAGPRYLLDNVRGALDACEALGQADLVLPALMPDNFATLAKLDASIEILQRAGELCAARGIRFGYHNHDWELSPVDGVVPYERMLARIAPELMAMQIDVYWITKGGREPLEFLRAHPGRFSTMHLKDIDATGDFADVGDGMIDFPTVTRAALTAGTRYFFVERDNPPAPMQTAQRAYDYLTRMRLA
ncbi:MAG: sugar phosphate isomerase/epimerase [Pseudomonadota bacterium]